MRPPFSSAYAAWFFAVVAFIPNAVCAASGVSPATEGTSDVFLSVDSGYAAPLVASAAESDTLRVFSVEERTGIPRKGELVRAPVFFAEGECRSLAELAVVADDAPGTSVEVQFDDIRRGPDGGISRVHVWFATDLPAFAHRRFRITKRSAAASEAGRKPTEIRETKEALIYATDEGEVTWSRRSGGLKSVRRGDARWTFDGAGLGPSVLLQVSAAKEAAGFETRFDGDSKREVAWASGPLFAKMRIRIVDPNGAVLTQEMRVPRHGREVVVTTDIIPGVRARAALRDYRVLTGELEGASASNLTLTDIPAGVRFALRAEQPYTVNALTSAGRRSSLLAVPLVIGGPNGRFTLEGKQLSLRGQTASQRGNEGEKDSLRGFWNEVRLVPIDTAEPESLWRAYRDHVQPLVAVVEEPGASVESLHAALQAIAREMKPIGWRQDAGRAWVLGSADRMQKILSQPQVAKEADQERLVRGAENSRAKLTQNGKRKLREDEKGRAYGMLDPYHITYTQSAAAALGVLADVPDPVHAVGLAYARGVREVGGRADATGLPYIDCFNRTLNMQMGPMLFGLTEGKRAGDEELVRFYRDLATSPPVLGVFGRGQRPYTGAAAKDADQTDYLYQAISDFWLRTAELLAGENLQLHPLAYGRYTDCIDVTADLYHGEWAKDQSDSGDVRANFFRGQAHTHRWLGWSCAPFIRLLQAPEEEAKVGLTEAIRYAQARKGHWKNWPDLTFYLLADLLVREGLTRASPVTLPAPPADVRVQRNGATAQVSWTPAPGAASYRIYRAEKPGGPYRWLNSPYTEPAGERLTGTGYRDAKSTASAGYVVTSVDANGRESAWPDTPAMR